MPNSKDTITNRLQRALLQIAESSDAAVQHRLEAVGLILKAKELAKLRAPTTSRNQPKLAISSIAVLGSR